jgi:GT2 family glycosyltransferase
MRLIVVIPTVDRREVLERTVAHLTRQTRQPDAVVISTPELAYVPEAWTTAALADGARTGAAGHPFPIICLLGTRGLPAQRNRALDALLGPARDGSVTQVLGAPLSGNDVVVFFDDDFLPADDYLAEAEKGFIAHPDWSVLTGTVAYDGANTAGYSFEQGFELLQQASTSPRVATAPIDSVGAYGCNMMIRARSIGALRFDERLPLYAWQEDIDFTSQLRAGGRVGYLHSLVGVHLGTKAGRVKGVRFGYSQIANPLYLIRKGTMPARFGLGLMVRNFAANIAKSLWPETYVDRRGRLYGNLVALGHMVTGRLAPEHIMKL